MSESLDIALTAYIITIATDADVPDIDHTFWTNRSDCIIYRT